MTWTLKAIFDSGSARPRTPPPSMRSGEVQRLRAQLPDGMKDCTIKFLECEKGHGRLTAANWTPQRCHWCEIEQLRAAVAELSSRPVNAAFIARDALKG